MAVDNGFRYPFDIHTALEPWRKHLTDADFDGVVAMLADRDRRLEDLLGMGRWLSYTPVLTCPLGVNPTLGTGSTAIGRYTRFGRTIIGNARIQFGSGGGAAAGTGTYNISLPTGREVQSPYDISASCGSGDIIHISTADRHIVVPRLTTTSTTTVVLSYHGVTGVVTDAAPFVWAAGDTISIQFIYDGESV
jgi:hypothetical protein